MGSPCGLLDHVLPRAHQLDDDQRQVRKAQRVGLALARQKALQRARVGRRWAGPRRISWRPPTMRSQRSGERTTRRRALPPCCARNCAVQVLVAIMNSSINWRARFCTCWRMSDHTLALEHGARLKGLQIQRALGAGARRACAGPRRPACATARPCRPRRAPPRARRHHRRSMRPPRRRPAWPGCAPGRGARWNRSRRRSASTIISVTMASRSSLQVERGQVGGQALGQHGKDPRRGIDRGGVGVRVRVDRRSFS